MIISKTPFLLAALATIFTSTAAPSATVDWANKEGIAAIYTVDGGSSAKTKVAVFGTDGNIYVMSDPENWKKYKGEWPVPLNEIVEWMPGLPNSKGYGSGIIKTTSGKWWMHKAMLKGNGDWYRKWVVLTLEEITAVK